MYWTLKGAVRKEIEDHRSNNKLFQAYRISPLRKAIRGFVRRPLVTISILSIFISMICYFVKDENLKEYIFVNDTKSGKFISNLSLSLLAAQAAILGIVYPIVIGLVSIFLSGQSAKKTRITIFLSETEVRTIGFSSFLFLMTISVETLFLDKVENAVFLILTSVNVLWFVANLVGTAYFLWTSQSFLMPDGRIDVLKRYTANVSWPLEMQYRLKQLFWLNAGIEKLGIIPIDNKFGVDVRTSPFYGDSGQPVVYKKFSTSRVLDDIWLFSLRHAVNCWIRREKDNSINKNSSISGFNKPTLTFPLMPGNSYPGEYDLGKAINIALIENTKVREMSVTDYEAILICLSFRFSRKRWHEFRLEVTDTLKELASGVGVSISDEKEIEYEEAWKEFLGYHSFLMRLSIIKPTGDVPWDNLSLLQETPGWRTTISSLWLRQYGPIFRRAISKLERNSSFFDSICHAPERLLRDFGTQIPHKLFEEILNLSNRMHFELCRYWGEKYDRIANEPRTYLNGGELPAPYSGIYTSALRNFVGVWESLIFDIFRRQEGEKIDEGELVGRRVAIASSHLELSALMVGRAVVTADIEGMRWLVDVLLRWSEGLDIHLRESHFWYFRAGAALIDTGILTNKKSRENWRKNSRYEDGVRSNVDDLDIFTATSRIALKNRWKDTILIVISTFLNWYYYPRIEREGEGVCPPTDATNRLLNCVFRDHRMGERHCSKVFSQPEDVMISIVRILSTGERWSDGSYRSELDAFSERLDNLNDEEWVPGRVYSSNTENGVSALVGSVGIILLASSLSSQTTSVRILPENWVDEFFGDDHRGAERVARYSSSVADWLAGESIEGIQRVLLTLGCDSLKEIESVRDRLVEGLRKISSNRDDNLRNRIIEGIVSERRLKEISEASSEFYYNKEGRKFPLSFVKNIVLIDSLQEREWVERRLIFNSYQKGTLLDVPLVSLASNENEWLGETVGEHVANIVLNMMIQSLAIEHGTDADPEKIWGIIKQRAPSLRRPVLVVSWQKPPEWVMRWTRGREIAEDKPIPADFDFTRVSVDADKSRFGKIAYNKDQPTIEVLRGAIAPGHIALFDSDQMDELAFRKYGNELPMQAEFEPSADDQTIGRLIINWSMIVPKIKTGIVINAVKND